MSAFHDHMPGAWEFAHTTEMALGLLCLSSPGSCGHGTRSVDGDQVALFFGEALPDFFQAFVDVASRSTLSMPSVSSLVLAAWARARLLATILRACIAFGWSDQRKHPRPKARVTFSSASSPLRLKRTPLSDLYSTNSKPSSLKKFLKLCSRKLLH